MLWRVGFEVLVHVHVEIREERDELTRVETSVGPVTLERAFKLKLFEAQDAGLDVERLDHALLVAANRGLLNERVSFLHLFLDEQLLDLRGERFGFDLHDGGGRRHEHQLEVVRGEAFGECGAINDANALREVECLDGVRALEVDVVVDLDAALGGERHDVRETVRDLQGRRIPHQRWPRARVGIEVQGHGEVVVVAAGAHQHLPLGKELDERLHGLVERHWHQRRRFAVHVDQPVLATESDNEALLEPLQRDGHLVDHDFADDGVLFGVGVECDFPVLGDAQVAQVARGLVDAEQGGLAMPVKVLQRA